MIVITLNGAVPVPVPGRFVPGRYDPENRRRAALASSSGDVVSADGDDPFCARVQRTVAQGLGCRV